jgi:hypothetical protein
VITFDAVCAQLSQKEAKLLEEECAALVGTGQDLAVIREPPSIDGDRIRVRLVFQRIPGGSVPSFACVVYRVSALGAFAQA